MIPLLDLRAQYQGVSHEIEAAALRVLSSGQYVMGPEVEAFEQAFAGYCNVRHAIAVNSGTSALHLALLAAGVGQGHEVITTPFTFVATTAAICLAGARPVFVDIDPVSLNLDPTHIAAAITPRTRAILPVHLHGMTADMDPILSIARQAGIHVIEDACQAHGALYHGRRAGSMGISGCFSFYPGKNLGAAGEGGMVVTDDDDQAAHIRCLRDWGQEGRYNHVMRGFNYRMDALQAAILGVKLRHLEAWTEARRAHARRYDSLLRGSAVETPHEISGCRHVYHVYAVRSAARGLLRAALASRGVDTGMHYPRPVHLQKAYADLGYREGDFPCAETAAEQVLSLPLYPELSERQIDIVAAAVRSDAYAA
ncbi:erythromycin biosynthesis sensory transduction protein eryC1 [Devosia geojensis]|uniref:Erythromycin biosynthesis sensory transduction protein eryC1 n=1 Tax=Devosia geojensis TaxID=443610 RepID=A0A0F5FSG4_9HYPH|nr:DegT/DnrJ/EryC1/StrS family aminotransferase [Devosia geojensis]KKB11773.1 erythromycin biosynthesis sensory transduction protein eryC1 [Devosia geojensis]